MTRSLRLLLGISVALVFFGPPARASLPTAEALRALGCKVVERDGAVVELSAAVKTFTAADYRVLGACTTLRKINLNGATLTDDTLPLLAGLAALEEFSTNASALTDDGYRHFAAFRRLRVLQLWHPSWNSATFTGSGLAHLRSLERLEHLTFAGSTAGDTALEAIGQLTQLREFQTWHTYQTAAGNRHLANLTQLRRLKLGQRLPHGRPTPAPSFDAATIPLLARLPALESLELFEAVLTSDDLLPLREAPKLRRLKIHTVEIAADDVARLRVALPAVQIDHTPLTDAVRQSTLRQKLKLLP